MILYVETNFPMGIATGRDPQAEDLLLVVPSQVHIVIPSACFMEAFSTLEDQRKWRNRFTNELDKQISQLRRNVTSPHAKSLLFHLEQSRIENQRLLNDVQARLFQAIEQLCVEAELIELNTDILQESLKTILIDEPTDNLILACILHHARRHPTEVRVLLSGNVRNFGSPEAQEALCKVGVGKYFSSTQAFLDWLQSQPAS